MNIIAYHGSQNNNIILEDRPIYLTSDKEMAIEWAKGYGFNYDLTANDKPTLYTMEINTENPMYITKDEYEDYMDITLWEEGYDQEVRDATKGHDCLICKMSDCTYYMPISAKSCKIIEKQEFPNKYTEDFKKLNEELRKYL